MNKDSNNIDDYCDIYENKICDNCGRCLENEGVDTKAINIESISKNVEENKFLEEEYNKALQEFKNDSEVEEEPLEENSYAGFEELLSEDKEYIDAFDNIEYIEDIDSLIDCNLDETTTEIYPGIRKIR